MAALSTADTTFMAEMATHMQGVLVSAKTYLGASPGDRRANITELAREVVETADECCCGGVGCACCCAGCGCYDGGCGCCEAGCCCGEEPDPGMVAST